MSAPRTESALDAPAQVAYCLRKAQQYLSEAHALAGEQEDGHMNLTGSVRDLVFGLNTSVDSLAQMIEGGRFNA